VCEQVPECPQTRPSVLQHRNPVGAQLVGLRLVDRRGQVRQYDEGLVGVRGDMPHGSGERVVAVVLLDQVHRQRDRVHRVVVGQRGQAAGEELLGVCARAPHVQRVGGGQAGLEQTGEPGGGCRRQRRHGHLEPLGEVGDQDPLGAGVVDGRDAAVTTTHTSTYRERL
jgi:hypothetical protein